MLRRRDAPEIGHPADVPQQAHILSAPYPVADFGKLAQGLQRLHVVGMFGTPRREQAQRVREHVTAGLRRAGHPGGARDSLRQALELERVPVQRHGVGETLLQGLRRGELLEAAGAMMIAGEADGDLAPSSVRIHELRSSCLSSTRPIHRRRAGRG